MRHHDPSCIVVCAGVREPGAVFAKVREVDAKIFHMDFKDPTRTSFRSAVAFVTGSGGSGKTTFMLTGATFTC
jgi:predicted ATPase